MSGSEICSAEDVELVINFDGTLSLNSQMRDARGIVLPLISALRRSVPNLKIDFSYFGDRTLRPHNFNRWILPDLNQSCHMPILPLTDDLDFAVERLDRILKRFVPVSGGLDDPAEDSLGSLYKILSNFQIRDFHRRRIATTTQWSTTKWSPTPTFSREKLRIILTVSDSKGHHAEDGTTTNQGPLEFPPIPDLSEEPLVCDPRSSYVPLPLLADKLRVSEEEVAEGSLHHTHLITYTDQAFTGWWFWLYDQVGVSDRSTVVSGDISELLAGINQLICNFSDSLKNTTPWPIQPTPALPPLLFTTTNPGYHNSLPPPPPWGVVVPTTTTTTYPQLGGGSMMPSGLLRFLMVMILGGVFVCGCCATRCLKKTAYLKPDVEPTVSMAPADSVAASEYRDEMASVTSGQYA